MALFVFDADGVLSLANARRRAPRRPAARAARPQVGRGARARRAARGRVAAHARRSRSAARRASSRCAAAPCARRGGPTTLVVAADLSRALRAEERHAFERLVRVLGHEINNSLAPIRSIADSLRARAARPLADDAELEDDLSQRARGHRAPLRGARPLHELLRAPDAPAAAAPRARRRRRLGAARGRAREAAGRSRSSPGRQATRARRRRPARSAAHQPRAQRRRRRRRDRAAPSRSSWETRGDTLEVRVRDEGPGLSDTTNLFVPFFTTKADRQRHRPRAVAPDRREPRRHADAARPHRPPRLRSAPVATEKIMRGRTA